MAITFLWKVLGVKEEELITEKIIFEVVNHNHNSKITKKSREKI